MKTKIMIVLFSLFLILSALKPLAYTPNNDVWSYAQNSAGATLREINCVRPTPSSTYSCQVVTHSGGEGYGLGVTPQIALDAALNNLP